MPTSLIGQLITFSVDQAADEHFTQYRYIRARKNDTVLKIAARLHHPEQAAKIASLNKIRSTRSVLKQNRRIRVPGSLISGDGFDVLADDPRPVIKDGYAQY